MRRSLVNHGHIKSLCLTNDLIDLNDLNDFNFFFFFWGGGGQTKSKSIKTVKKNEASIQPPWLNKLRQ